MYGGILYSDVGDGHVWSELVLRIMISISHTHTLTFRLVLVPVKTLQMSEDVLSVCYSPDQRLLASSLLDSTIKVFFADSLKVQGTPLCKSFDSYMNIRTLDEPIREETHYIIKVVM